MTQTLAGVFPVLPTIFDDQGRVDDDGMRRVVDFVIDCGADGLVFPGLASEHDQLSIEERLRLIALVGARVNGRVRFVVGASAPSLDQGVALVVAGADAGAAAAMVMTPAQFGENSDRLAEFYRSLGEAGGLPIMLQNAPTPMGCGLSADEVLAIIRNAPNIPWVKEENQPGGHRIDALLQARPAHLLGVFGGAGGRYITDELARGALGTMPAAELPEAHIALYAAHKRGNESTMRDVYERMLPLLMMQAVFRWSLTKEVLRRRGLIGSAFVRAPGPRMDSWDHRELDQIMARLSDLLIAPAVAA